MFQDLNLPSDNCYQLKRKLFDEYGGFADKRIRNLNKGQRFIVDDRSSGDFGAQGLYSYFCSIFVDVMSGDKVKVVLSGNVPVNQGVRDWAASHQVETSSDIISYLSFIIEKGQENILNELANCIKAIVAPSAPRYDTPSYKYVCPRTASSLLRLASILNKHWNT